MNEDNGWPLGASWSSGVSGVMVVETADFGELVDMMGRLIERVVRLTERVKSLEIEAERRGMA